MSQIAQNKTANGLLRALNKSDFALLGAKLSYAELAVRRQLEKCNRPVEHAYFFESGIGSTVVAGGTTHSIEVGVLGREGMSGLSIIHEADFSLYETVMQSAGSGWRIAADDLMELQRNSLSLRRVLLRYAHTVMTQLAFTALANGRYKLEERLARWLLMAQDRIDGDTVKLTHEFLALMLGTRRAGVTVGLGTFESRGITQGTRGAIKILDRDALVECSNGCYGGAENEYRRLFQPGTGD